MLYFCVNRAPQSANPSICHTSEKSPLTPFLATHPKSLDLKPFVCHTSKKEVPQHPGQSSSTFAPLIQASGSRALCSLFALFRQRVFHISFAIKRIRTLSHNCRVAWVLAHQTLKVLLEVFHHVHCDLSCCFPST